MDPAMVTSPAEIPVCSSSTSELRSGEAHDARTGRGETFVCPAPSFERRRAVAWARERLFGVRSGLRIGRFRVVGRLGAGGMGEVYLGVDEELDRTVALKRMLLGVHDDARVPSQERLRREARALAKLSHPNVVQVYEIGEHEGRIFLAMEHVDGQTLRQWLAHGQRSWREVLECFVDAGRGLAAAHRAGVIHRDFKPENVLIGRDGRVRVVDFGLALEEAETTATVREELPELDGRLTTTGGVLGTIRYMPLEQLRGRSVDERSDLFAFCVSLYEALWGGEPFDAISVGARLEALQDGRVRAPRSAKPAFVWRAVRRGLARDPDERWPDMDALLDALSGRRRARWGVGVTAAGISVVGAAAWLAVTPAGEASPGAAEAELCERRGAEPWSSARRQALVARFDRSSEPHASSSKARVLANLDLWSAGWQEQRGRVCGAEVALADPERRRIAAACVQMQRIRTETLVELVLDDEGAAGPDPLVGVVEASFGLPVPERCEDEAELRITMPPAELEAEFLGAYAELSAVHQLRMLRRNLAASRVMDAAQARADALGHRPLVAEAMAERAWLHFELGMARATSSFLTAIDLAEVARHERLVAHLRIQGAIFVAQQLGNAPAARAHLEGAELAWPRLRTTPRERSRLTLARGLVLALEPGGEARAEVELRRALEELGERDFPLRVSIHDALVELLETGEPSRAEVEAERALEASARTWGPRHPLTAASRRRLHALRDRLGVR